LAGDLETGVCLMRIDAGLDTGPVYACVKVPIGPRDTAGELHTRLVDAGTALLVERLPSLVGATPVPQTGEATYAEKLEVSEFRLDSTRGADELDRLVRAGNPRPGAWFSAGGRRVKVWQAHANGDSAHGDAVIPTADGALVLDEVQPEGKRPMPGRAWRAGLHGAIELDEAP
jgi:methionyl-tRNA formyltransferase